MPNALHIIVSTERLNVVVRVLGCNELVLNDQ